MNETLQHHLAVMKELVQRDKNRAAVIMWSLANEPQTNSPYSESYFKSVTELTRSLDKTRPVTFVTDQPPGDDYAVSKTVTPFSRDTYTHTSILLYTLLIEYHHGKKSIARYCMYMYYNMYLFIHVHSCTHDSMYIHVHLQ